MPIFPPLRYCMLGMAVPVVYTYMSNNTTAYEHLFMPLALWMDPERAHRLVIRLSAWNMTPKDNSSDSPKLKIKVFGKVFRNPIGLAAGCDKHAEGFFALLQMGFSHVEVGTVTPLPQEGNPRPRVFRLKEDHAVINRYGFNSHGSGKVAKRLNDWQRTYRHHMENQWMGVNIGRNKDTFDPVGDYVRGTRELGPVADYLVINVSSPNTPGLRNMQGKAQLEQLLDSVCEERNKLETPPPLLVKISPDLSEQDKEDIASVVTREENGVDGIIVTNTTVTRPLSLTSPNKHQEGGLSGRPLTTTSLQTIRDMYRLTKGTIPIIGVGGISSGQDAYNAIVAGATLVQLYTAFIYEGPPIVRRIKNELLNILKDNGFKFVQEAVGAEHRMSRIANRQSGII